VGSVSASNLQFCCDLCSFGVFPDLASVPHTRISCSCILVAYLDWSLLLAPIFLGTFVSAPPACRLTAVLLTVLLVSPVLSVSWCLYNLFIVIYFSRILLLDWIRMKPCRVLTSRLLFRSKVGVVELKSPHNSLWRSTICRQVVFIDTIILHRSLFILPRSF